MAVDVQEVIQNLNTFYDFNSRSVIHVGAGGGQLILYAGKTERVLAVDNDADAVEKLRQAVAAKDLSGQFNIVCGDFADVEERADVVFFEFCLHEMPDPAAMLVHGLELAPEVLILDHDRESRWAWHACETEKAEVAWKAVEGFQVGKSVGYAIDQVFETHAQLVEKVSCMGETAIERAATFEGKTDFTIPMKYRAALVVGK